MNLEDLIHFKYVNQEDAYGIYGQILYALFRIGFMTRTNKFGRTFEIQIGFTIYSDIRLIFGLNDKLWKNKK